MQTTYIEKSKFKAWLQAQHGHQTIEHKNTFYKVCHINLINGAKLDLRFQLTTIKVGEMVLGHQAYGFAETFEAATHLRFDPEHGNIWVFPGDGDIFRTDAQRQASVQVAAEAIQALIAA